MSDELFNVDDRPGLDDPIWDYVIESRLRPYIERAREWWANVHNFEMIDTGIIEIDENYPGLYARFTRTAVRSPVKGIQAFPFIPIPRLQITGVQGGVVKMIDRRCLNNRLKIDEFTIVAKSNLPSTFSGAQIIAIIPTEIMESRNFGVWLYFTPDELSLLARGETNDAIRLKAMLKA
jgi:hypothetical protein